MALHKSYVNKWITKLSSHSERKRCKTRWHPVTECSVRSAALLNPNSQIVIFSKTLLPSPHWRDLPNLQIRDFHFEDEFSKSEPIYRWYNATKLTDSNHGLYVYHLADALRILLMKTKGGVYLDSDTIVLKSLSRVNNSIGRQDSSGKHQLNNAFLVFDKGNPCVKMIEEQIPISYQKLAWGSLGPELMTKVIPKCLKTYANITPPVVKILSRRRIYPLHYSQGDVLLSKAQLKTGEAMIAKSLTLQLWRHGLDAAKTNFEVGSLGYQLFMNICAMNITHEYERWWGRDKHSS